MSGYNYSHFLKNFADRTAENLQIIDTYGCDSERREVTQLINSLLGLLVVPSEKFKEDPMVREHALKRKFPTAYQRISDLISALEAQKKLFNDYPYRTPWPVTDFIRHLRNAICHSGDYKLLFIPIGENKPIKAVIFYDAGIVKDKNTGKEATCQFCAELTIAQIRDAITSISQMYIAVENESAKNAQEEYQKKVVEYQNLMASSTSSCNKGKVSSKR